MLIVVTVMFWQWMPAVIFVSYLLYGLVRPWISRKWQQEIEDEAIEEVEDTSSSADPSAKI